MKNKRSKPLIVELNHVQLAMPVGQEVAAEQFYCGVLGFKRVSKPAHLQKRGGCWFKSGEVKLHLGVEYPFVPSRKAHPAFVVGSLSKVKALLKRAGFEIILDTQLDGFGRFYTADPFGNRIELMQRQPVAPKSGQTGRELRAVAVKKK
jgi:catechol 2,3-dioxygenase-like lactoylglutathione lyase family enzyme